MDRKLLNSVDGFAVDEYQGTFTGTFDVQGVDAKYLAYDDEVLIVVRARVKPPRLKELKNGDIVRVNVLGVKEGAVVRSDELKKHLCDSLGLEQAPPQLTLDSVLDTTVTEQAPDQGVRDDVPTESHVHTNTDQTDVEVFTPEAGPVVPGPQVVRFRPDEKVPDTPVEVERPAAIKQTKDKRLAAFLSES